MRPKVLWVSSTTNPNACIRPNASSYTYLEVYSIYDSERPEIAKASSFGEFKEALELNKKRFFNEICIDYDLTPTHNGIDCIKYLRDFCKENSLRFPRITSLSGDPNKKTELLSHVYSAYKALKDMEKYM